MKINGSLKFDASGLSQIENLRVEKVTTGAFPTWTSNDVGRLVYNSTTQVMWLGGASSWIALATGGDAASLAAEVDALEASLGPLINNDGTFNAAGLGGNLANSTSVTNVFTKLQTLVAAAQASADAEAARAIAREDAIEDALDAEVLRATAAEGANTTAIGNEVTRATAAEGALGTRIDVEEDAREAGDGVNADAIDAEVTRATGAEDALSTRITTEVNDRVAAIDEVAADIAQEITDRQNAITGVNTALGNEVTRATAEEAAIRGELAAALAGLSWEEPVVAMGPDHTAATGLTAGDRVANTTDFKIYTWNGTTFDAGQSLEDGGAFFNSATDIGYTFNGTAIVPFSGTASFVAGAGLSTTGNVVNIGNTDGSITVTADNIAVSSAVRTEITDNASAIAAEVTRATTAEAGLQDSIEDEAAARDAADDALQAAIDAEVAARIADVDAAEAASTAAILAETTRATGREDAIEDALESEVTRATAAETANTTAVTNLTNRVNKMYFLYQIDNSTPAAAAAVHQVNHNLGVSYCNVTVVDDTNNVVIPESIVFNTPNQLTVSFNSAIPCRVVVMGLAAV